MNVVKYQQNIDNLQLGQVLTCETESCEICGLSLGKYITPSSPMWAVKLFEGTEEQETKRSCYSCFLKHQYEGQQKII